MLRVTTTPHVRAVLTDDDLRRIQALDLDGFLMMLADSKRGPFTVKLAVNGVQPIKGEGSTLPAALASVLRQVTELNEAKA